MINIKQLPQINVQLWPNVIHMGYMTEVIRRMGLEWNQETPCPAKLQTYLTAVQTAFQREDQAYDGNMQQEAAASELGLTQIITQLVAKNTEVETLMGQPVSPADEVDSEKEYGLVAYEHESEEKNENN